MKMTKAQFQETIEAFEQKHQNNPVYYIVVEDGAISLDMKDIEGWYEEPYIYYSKGVAIQENYFGKKVFRNPEQLRAALESYVANT